MAQLRSSHYLRSMGCTFAIGLSLLASACGYGPAPSRIVSEPAARSAALSIGAVTARVAAAGDVACPTALSKPGCRAADTAALVRRLNPQRVLVLGDLAYDNGSASEFANGYAPTWGAFKSKSFPVPGNHEYNTSGAQPYKDWWGAMAMPSGTTWHSMRLGGWLVLGLDSNCGDSSVGGCGPDSAQGKWLAAQLKGSPRCVLAIWHHPRRSSGPHGDNASVAPLWQQLANAHADLVLQGHDHDYERFAPADAAANPAKPGMVGMVVGTGGKQLYPIVGRSAGSLVRVQGVNGVLALDLHQRGWAWRFTGTDGRVRDSGSAACRT